MDDQTVGPFESEHMFALFISMDNQFKILDIVGHDILFPWHAPIILSVVSNYQYAYLDMSGINGCTSAFVNKLVYEHQKLHRFYGRLAFFNVVNPIVSMKILDAYINFSTEQHANDYIKMMDEILNNMTDY